MALGLADQILVWAYSDTDAYTLETCDWYSAESFAHLHLAASEFIVDQLDLFYGEFSEWFNLAEFPDVLGQLQPSEVAVFFKAARAPADADSGSIENCDCFSGLRAVIRHRLDQRSLEQIKLAAHLFNWTTDFGLGCCDTNACAVIRIGSAKEVAPFLLQRVLNQIPADAKRGNQAWQDQPSSFDRRFLPLAPVLTMLKETIESADWVQNQLALRLFFWIAEMYKMEVE